MKNPTCHFGSYGQAIFIAEDVKRRVREHNEKFQTKINSAQALDMVLNDLREAEEEDRKDYEDEAENWKHEGNHLYN